MPDRRWWHRLRLDGTTVVPVAGSVSQQERLEGQEAFAATVRVGGAPSASEGDAVDLALADLDAATGVWQLQGVIDAIDATSYPHEQVWTLVDVMARCRRARESDLLLTGTTDGGVVQTALTFAGVVFDPADIQDAGYVLGEKTDVFWLADRTAGDLIAELDALFQMRTFSLDDGRVVRKRYTLWPTTADAVATYDRGNATVEPYLFGAQRSRGRFDEIVNAVRVDGASYECGDGCRCRVWARAEADHPALGAGVRTRPLLISSDFIQSTGLAEAIAQDAMKRVNRLRDRVRVTTENDPNVTIGKAFKARDAAAGIDLVAYRAYAVAFVDRLGNRMILEGVGGSAGAVGTVTSGIEQQCNRTTIDLPEAPSFSMPGFGAFPAIGNFGVTDAIGGGGEDNPGGTGSGGGGGDLIGQLDEWVCDSGGCDLIGGEPRMPAGAKAHTTEVDFVSEAPGDWEIAATVGLADGATECAIGLGPDGFGLNLSVFFGSDIGCDMITWDDLASDPTEFAAGPVDVTITHDHGAETTRFRLVQGAATIDETLPHTTHTGENHFCFTCDGGEATLTACVVTIG